MSQSSSGFIDALRFGAILILSRFTCYVNGKANGEVIYAATSTSYKLAAKTESSKYSTGGSADVETNDGGINTSTYEQGTNLAL